MERADERLLPWEKDIKLFPCSMFTQTEIQKDFKIQILKHKIENLNELQSELRNKLFIRPFDAQSIESSAIKLCDCIFEFNEQCGGAIKF
jgi:hypothetical protein